MKLIPIFESVITPTNFKDGINLLKTTPQIESIEELENIFNGEIKFISLKQYAQLEPEGKLPYYSASVIEQNFGVGAGTVIDGKIYIMCNPRTLLKNLSKRNYNSFERKQLIQNIAVIARHESIHVQQIQKAGDKIKDVNDISTDEKMQEYFANKQELMAYAQTIIDNLVDGGFTLEEIEKDLKKGAASSKIFQYSNIFQTYKRRFKSEPKVLNRLYKYLYQTVQNEKNLQEQTDTTPETKVSELFTKMVKEKFKEEIKDFEVHPNMNNLCRGTRSNPDASIPDLREKIQKLGQEYFGTQLNVDIR